MDEGIASTIVIYTVGHSNISIESFLELLRQHRIEQLVDVRSAPFSRYVPHFNRLALEASVKSAGIHYAFAGDRLGGRPKDPSCYTSEANQAGGSKVDYGRTAEQPWFKEGLAGLIEKAGVCRTAIMCSEEDPASCHRHHLITASLLDRHIEVKHIRKSGRLEDAQRSEAPQEQLGFFSEGLA